MFAFTVEFTLWRILIALAVLWIVLGLTTYAAIISWEVRTSGKRVRDILPRVDVVGWFALLVGLVLWPWLFWLWMIEIAERRVRASGYTV